MTDFPDDLAPEYRIVERRTEIVFPTDANSFGTLFGGKALASMDVVAAIAAIRACHKQVVTASISRTDFREPVHVGEFMDVIARVVGVGRTSITIEVELWGENPVTRDRRLSAVGKFVMVAVDEHGHPTPVQTEE